MFAIFCTYCAKGNSACNGPSGAKGSSMHVSVSVYSNILTWRCDDVCVNECDVTRNPMATEVTVAWDS